MAASAGRPLCVVGSLRSVKSGGHCSESPSHCLFLYVKPSNVALQRYHETCLPSRLMPPGGISARLRGLPPCTPVPSFGFGARLGNNPRPSFARTEHLLAGGPLNTIHTVVYLCCWSFSDPWSCSKLSSQVRGRRRASSRTLSSFKLRDSSSSSTVLE